jgi:hypothetical protein
MKNYVLLIGRIRGSETLTIRTGQANGRKILRLCFNFRIEVEIAGNSPNQRNLEAQDFSLARITGF